MDLGATPDANASVLALSAEPLGGEIHEVRVEL